MNLLVYVPVLSPRIRYIFNFIFKDILKTELTFSQDLSEFMKSSAPKFCYAEQEIGGMLNFKSSGFLNENTIRQQDIHTTYFGDHRVPFALKGGSLPFDVFAASFFILSRYEEYTPGDPQKSYQYHPEQSLQHRLGLLQFPVIDGWALILKNILLKHFPQLSIGKKDFSFTPVYSLQPLKLPNQHKKNIISGFLEGFLQKRGWIDTPKDPLESVHRYIAKLNKQGAIERPKVLFPPAPQSADYEESIQLPKSYVKLLQTDINEDYRMYYPEHPGFRAGTCTAFCWYDLQMEKQTQLKVYPIAVADSGLLHDQKIKEPMLQINELVSNTKLVNGSFYSLWHHSPPVKI